MTKKELFAEVLNILSKKFPVAQTELHYTNPYELLVAVMLSAQCTDKRVNMFTPRFFERFPTPEALARSHFDEVYPYIRSISYPNSKTKHLIEMAQMLVTKFKSKVPETVEELMSLPGVGRKTAHVITSVLFNQPNLAVDTHVQRVAARIGLTQRARTPLQTEQQLVKYIPRHMITKAHHWLILHGRYTCLARNPKCDRCELRNLCKYFRQMSKKKSLKKLSSQ
jgi:endonuclease-3